MKDLTAQPPTMGPVKPKSVMGESVTGQPTPAPRPATRARPNRNERGSVTLVLLGAVVLAACVVVGVARVGAAAGNRARLDAAADLTALATVTGGESAGRRVAVANGAAVESIELHTDTVVVHVSAGGEVASAAARPAR